MSRAISKSGRLAGIVCFIFTLVGVAPTASAQSVSPYFRHLTREDGLAGDQVLTIFQDHQGFMWFGTTDGLNRYDGRRMSTYRALPVDSTSLPGNTIYSIFEDTSDVLWIGTDNGLARYDRLSDSFDQVLTENSPQVSAIHQDTTGSLLLGTFDGNGVYQLDPISGSFSQFGSEYGTFSAVSGIHSGRSGKVWITSNLGLCEWLGTEKKCLWRIQSTQEGGPANDQRVHILDLQEDRERAGVYWVFEAQGLSRYDTNSGQYQRLFTFPLESFAVEGVWWSMPQAAVSDPEHPDVFWLVNPNSGLFRFDSSTGHIQRFERQSTDTGQLHGSPHCVFIDRTGLIWIGTSSGVSRFDPAVRPFERFDLEGGYLRTRYVTGIAEDQSGALWVTTGDGLDFPTLTRIDRTTSETRHWYDDHWAHEPDAPDRQNSHDFGNVITSLYADRSGKLWITAIPTGLHRFDPVDESFQIYDHDREKPETIGSRYISSVIEDHDGTIWVGTDNGLDRLDLLSGTFDHYRSDAESEKFFPGSSVQILYEDRQQRLWVGSNNGLSYFEEETGRFIRYEPVSGSGMLRGQTSITALHESSHENGLLWVGSEAGLSRLDTGSGELTRFGAESGVPEHPVSAIFEDEFGRLWISTRSDGVYRYDPANGGVRRFGISHNVYTRDFWYQSGFKSRNGELFFGGDYGITAIIPGQSDVRSSPPPVVLTDFKLFGRSVPVGEDSPLSEPLSDTQKILLSHDQNSIAFEFAALHYANAAQNQYAYRLEGLNSEWAMVGDERAAVFTNLDPGQYVFYVKAANSDGIWNEDGASVQVEISPPWWRTWWAYAAYGVFLVVGIVGVDRFQRKRLVNLERDRARERELQQAREIEKAYHQLRETKDRLVQQEKMASLGQLTAGIAHEIRNPLNFVNNFAGLNEELIHEIKEALEENPELRVTDVLDVFSDLGQNVHAINEHGKRAEGIVRAMMQHASGGSGEREVTDVNALVEEYVNLAYHGKRAQQTGFACQVIRDFDDAVGNVEMVRQEIARVILNLVGNAFDAVQDIDDAEVVVTTEKIDDIVRIRVSDNGHGMPTEVRNKIFEPFYTTKPTGSGTGLGLSLSYEIVTKGHGGTLTVESEGGSGAIFTIGLPAANA